MNGERKNIFKKFKKDIILADIKFKDKIIWDKSTKMEDYINFVKSINIYERTNDSNEIKIDNYLDHKIIGFCEIKNNKYNSNYSLNYLYIIRDNEKKSLYVSIEKCHPIFWYKFLTKQDFFDNFDLIYDLYNRTNSPNELNGNISCFIGSNDILNLDIHDIENHFLVNGYSEKLIWGSKWSDYPFRDELTKREISHLEGILFIGQSMRQNSDDIYSVSVCSLFSKSIITICDYGDAFIMNIKYDKIDSPQIENLNKMYGRKYNLNIPIDVIILLLNFPFITYSDIMNMDQLTPYHFYVLSLLVESEDSLNIILSNLKINIENNSLDKETKEDNLIFLDYVNGNFILKKIIKENNLNKIINESDNDINLTINNLLKKYDCEQNYYVKNELFEFINSNMNIIIK